MTGGPCGNGFARARADGNELGMPVAELPLKVECLRAVTVLVPRRRSSNQFRPKCCRGILARFIGDRVKVVEAVKVDARDPGLVFDPGHQGVG